MIIEIFCCLSAGSVITLHLLNSDLSKWYTYLFALFGGFGAYALALLISFVVYYLLALPIKVGSEFKRPSKFYRFLYKEGVDYICNHSLIFCRFKGKDLLPRGKRFVLVCNHRSNFDPILISKKLMKYDVAFISKDANFKIPMVNRIITALCYMAVDRNNPLQSLSIFKRASNYVTSDSCSVGVFPEGKRYVGEGLEVFHEGFFNVAIKNNVPLVVCTVKGTENIAHNFPFKRSKVKIEVIRIYEPEEISNVPAKALSDEVRELMLRNLTEDKINEQRRSK